MPVAPKKRTWVLPVCKHVSQPISMEMEDLDRTECAGQLVLCTMLLNRTEPGLHLEHTAAPMGHRLRRSRSASPAMRLFNVCHGELCGGSVPNVACRPWLSRQPPAQLKLRGGRITIKLRQRTFHRRSRRRRTPARINQQGGTYGQKRRCVGVEVEASNTRDRTYKGKTPETSMLHVSPSTKSAQSTSNQSG